MFQRTTILNNDQTTVKNPNWQWQSMRQSGTFIQLESVEKTGDSPASKDAPQKSAHCLPEEEGVMSWRPN